MNIEFPLRGIIPPVVSPLLSDNELDEVGLERLLQHLLKGGVHALFLLGTTGEACSLPYKLREKLIRRACAIIDKKVPVMVGITDTSFHDSIEMAHVCKEAGADMVVVAPPYYYPLAEIEMLRYLDDLVPKLPMPFLLYNIPSHTKLHLSIDAVKHARELGAVGYKDSSGDMLYLMQLIDQFKEHPDFSVITGTEMFIPENIRHGGHGAIAGGANLFPRLFVEFYNAAVEGDEEKIESLRKIVLMIYNTIYNIGTFGSRYTVGTKSALASLGICNDYVAHPLRKFNGKEKETIDKHVNTILEMWNAHEKKFEMAEK